VTGDEHVSGAETGLRLRRHGSAAVPVENSDGVTGTKTKQKKKTVEAKDTSTS